MVRNEHTQKTETKEQKQNAKSQPIDGKPLSLFYVRSDIIKFNGLFRNKGFFRRVL